VNLAANSKHSLVPAAIRCLGEDQTVGRYPVRTEI